MTITSTTTLSSGKTGVTITTNLDELAILRGLVVNALRHMPDVCETVQTRQRLKAMSRALHRVYSNVSFTESTVQATPEQVDKILAMIKNCKGQVWKPSKFVGEQCGENWAKKYTEAQSQEPNLAERDWIDRQRGIPNPDYVSHPDKTVPSQGVTSTYFDILKKMPDLFTFREFHDKVIEPMTLLSAADEKKIWLDVQSFLLSLPVKEYTVDHNRDTVTRTKPAGDIKRPTLIAILTSMPPKFHHTDFVKESTKHRYDITKATQFLNLSVGQELLHLLGPKSYEKVVSPKTADLTMLLGLIGD